MSIKYSRLTILFVLTLLFLNDFVSAQCSMCRAVLESEQGLQTAKGINDGIVYLMVIPYILVALVSWRVYKIYKS
ncbi:MAG: hypothetical protein CMC67_04190 [Flavobacteriaceae bacterium]|jgi:hypothetical protein|nr:hypothetical protein [Flavobacteriaceae bacterium]|tara:strand:+ start:4732 stop:4956 length:225 start_codon:yes stop_codon:yes gene_type:complete